ncbi:sensor domain-containing diguanylate cyclase [Halalkalibacter nanhaiisediminis]|uniref:Diguanylate cyclase (GGDEF)-like protein n=1 Tax=Halalkalibacter nanhaiisediminis TaxID=688079 RepID=A0A562QE50_9BACI|nr:diguanylate cyclase [Halalkalibacter nanhaiisediminis]TWI54450.1 diguanylate cyclase (GGDEF)-like protein [Halalkalibacter nanhaiisediminis]
MKHFHNNVMSIYLLLVIILLIITSVSSYISITQIEKETNQILVDAIPFSRAAENLLTQLVNQDTGVRGFISTKNEDFLAPYNIGKARLVDHLKTIRLHQDNHPIMKDIMEEDALPQIEIIQEYFDSQIALVKDGNVDTARERLDYGKVLMDRYRDIHTVVEQDITNIINHAWNKSNIATNRSKVIILTNLSLMLIIGIAATVYFMKLNELNKKLVSMVTIDALTQLNNRFSFDQKLKKEFEQSQKTQEPISLLLFDIDHFKRYNDNYGHLKGDVCLQQLAAEVRRTFQDLNAYPARYGGEEFAVILLNCMLGQATDKADQLRANIEALKLTHEYSPTHSYVTVSVGVATLTPLPNQRPQILIEQADLALYKAKETRNTVEVFEG